MKAIEHAKYVIHLSVLPQLRTLESLNEMKLNETLLCSLNKKSSGFLVSLGTHRTSFNESTIYLGCLEVDIFHLLDRINSKSHAIFEQQQQLQEGQDQQLVLIIQLDDLSGPRDFTCVIPLTKTYDMLRDVSPYSVFDNYFSFIYATSSQDNSNKQIYQLAFSCLPLLDAQNKPVDLHTNIFASYFKKASFAQENQKITEVYRIYTNEVLFNWDFETVDYLLLHYDGKQDLEASHGHQCFSEYFDDSRNQILASTCFGNDSFQLAMIYGSEPEAHLQFYLDVDYNVFNCFVNSCIEVDYGNDVLFVSENDCFVVRPFSTTQRRRTDLLSLVAQSFFNFLLPLYKGEISFEDVYAFVFKVCYRPSVFATLSVYIFKNLFRLATEHFEKTFDEICSVLFTCIVLSDVNFTRHTSVETVFNGGVLSIVYYFHSLYCMIVCGGS